MTAQKLITVGENENTVFRSCKDGIHTNVFETICAFLNTRGGTLLLGVDESGEVYGFKERAIPDIIQALKMATQNADTFQPPFEMEPVREIVDVPVQAPPLAAFVRFTPFSKQKMGGYQTCRSYKPNT